MSVQFSEISINNLNGIDIEVTVEAPIGSLVANQTVLASTSASITIGKTDTQTAKIIVQTDSHSGYQDIMAFDFSNSGTPYKIYIEKIEANCNIGKITGTASTSF